MTDKPPSPIRIRLFLLLIGGAAAIIALAWWTVPRPRPTLPELPRGSLFQREGRWYQTGRTNPFTGVMVECYPGGVPLSRSVISNGQLNGLSEGWYTNRQLQIHENFHAGVSDGLRTKWHPNGNKLSEATIVQGKIQGTFRRWHENGTLAEEIQMREGKPDGVCRAFYESGCLKSESRARAGQVIEQKSWKDGERPAP